jgi:hypothetical protein
MSDDRKAGWIVTGVLVVLFAVLAAAGLSVWLGGVVFNWVMGGG